MKNKYRIITDQYLGYEVQVKFWWFPFTWFQVDGAVTHSNVEDAEYWFRQRNKKQKVIKEIIS